MRKLSAALVGMVFALLASNASATEWKTISERDAKLHVTDIGEAYTSFRTAMSDDKCCRYEIGRWTSSIAGFPRAEFVLIELISKLMYIRSQFKLDRVLDRFNFLKDKNLEFYEIEKDWGRRLQYGRFRIPDAECVAIVHHFGEIFVGPEQGTGAGNSLYYGYYCDWKKRDIASILGAISIDGVREYEKEAETALPAPAREESIPITEDDLLTDWAVKRVIMEYYDAHGIKRAGNWAGWFAVSNMDEVVDITVNNISGTIATIDVEYVWSWRNWESRKGTDHGVATIEKTGSTYRVLKFTTGGMTYKAVAPGPVIVPAEPPPPVIDAQTLMNDRGFFRALNKATDKQYRIEIQRLDSVDVKSRSGNQARVILKYLWANDNDSQRVGRGEATVRSIGGQFEVTEFKSLFPTPSQLLRADAGASGI